MKKHHSKTGFVFTAFLSLTVAGVALSQGDSGTSPDGFKVEKFTVAVPVEAKVGDVAEVRMLFKNGSINPKTMGANGVFIGCRSGSDNRDFGHTSKGATLQPEQTIKFGAKIKLDKPGTWEFWPAYHVDTHYGPYRWMVKTITVADAAPPPPPKQ